MRGVSETGSRVRARVSVAGRAVLVSVALAQSSESDLGETRGVGVSVVRSWIWI